MIPQYQRYSTQIIVEHHKTTLRIRATDGCTEILSSTSRGEGEILEGNEEYRSWS
jgi:hypothetical protein